MSRLPGADQERAVRARVRRLERPAVRRALDIYLWLEQIAGPWWRMQDADEIREEVGRRQIAAARFLGSHD